MNTTALGTWHKPPLAYVVAEARISPYYSLAEKIAGLQDKLREKYPRTLETTELFVEGAKPSPQPIWQLLSEKQTHGVQFGTRAISLHATSYSDSIDFLTRWAEVLDAVQEAKLGAFVERAGLRYVDLIIPSDGNSPAAYLAPQLQGILPKDAQSTGSMWMSTFQFDGNNQVSLRVAAPSPAGMVLPPNFSPLPLAKPGVLNEAEERVKATQPIGFIDTDCSTQVQQIFDSAELVSIYSKMQKLASRTFKGTLSAAAQKEWV